MDKRVVRNQTSSYPFGTSPGDCRSQSGTNDGDRWKTRGTVQDFPQMKAEPRWMTQRISHPSDDYKSQQGTDGGEEGQGRNDTEFFTNSGRPQVGNASKARKSEEHA